MAGLLNEIGSILVTSLDMKRKLCVSFAPFTILLAAFVAFVRWNGSVVLGTFHPSLSNMSFGFLGMRNDPCYRFLLCSNASGAKEAHAVSPHFAQILYFGLFSPLAMSPLYFSLDQTINFFNSFWKSRPRSFFQALFGLIAGFISVHFFRSNLF